MARSCVFCGRQPVTAEDVFPQWLGHYLGRKRSYVTTGAAIRDRRPDFVGFSMTARAKRVCRECNNGWMSRMEAEAIPILKPLFRETIALQLSGGDEGGLRLLARWAMKTALMIQCVHKTPVIPSVVYRDFYGTRLPPSPQCWMFLARHTMHGIANGAHSIQWSVKGPPLPGGGPTYEGEMYGITFCIANLVIQIIGYVPTSPLEGSFQVAYPTAYSHYVEQLWPMGTGISWPLQRPVLDDEGLISFGRALSGLKASRGGVIWSPA